MQYQPFHGKWAADLFDYADVVTDFPSSSHRSSEACLELVGTF